MDVAAFLQRLTADPTYAGQLCYQHTVTPRPPVRVPFPKIMEAPARTFLRTRGIERLYPYQATAIAAVLNGQDVVISTGPASGKSVCYQVPMVQTLSADPTATTLLVFPTKALARDQAVAWNQTLDRALDPSAAATLRALPLDGDTSAGDRRQAREHGRVLVTNPEMLHLSMLPYHARWTRFFSGLRFVVLDEAHVYTGFFGANMANVLRRLERVAHVHGTRMQYLCTSATLGNPLELATRLTGRSVTHVSADTDPGGRRTFVIWNPPRIQARLWRGRRSANVEAHELMVRLLRDGIPTICFAKARNTAEMMYRYVRDTLRKETPALAARVIPYRGGYSSQERRVFEEGLRDGRTLGVCSTRALELGIDIGTLDACLIIGYPGTLNAFFQQAGRVGRSGRDALVILVTVDTPINQYVAQHPEFLFQRPLERAVVDPDNPFVVLGHMACSAAELPLARAEAQQFGYAGEMALEVLTEHGDLRQLGNAWYHTAAEPPALAVRLRGYGDESTVIVDVDGKRIIDRLDKFRALRLFYPGAIYFRGGDTYAMVDHDTEHNIVHVQRVDVPYYTDPVTSTAVDHVDVELDSRPLGLGTACLGEVFALASTPLYERVRFYTLERISQHEIDQPPFTYEAVSFWLRLPAKLPQAVARLGMNPEAGMKGILFCVSRILPLFLASDAYDFDWSIGCRNTPWHTLFWYEFYLRGIGNSEHCYQRLEEILGVTLEHLLACDCHDGCPNCTTRLITPYHVRNIELGEGNVGSRRTAAVLLHALLGDGDVEAGLAALTETRPRGRMHLPSADPEHWQREPQQLPLDAHTRQLLGRKLERNHAPRQPRDHAVDMEPPTGFPAPTAPQHRPPPTGPKARGTTEDAGAHSATPAPQPTYMPTNGTDVSPRDAVSTGGARTAHSATTGAHGSTVPPHAETSAAQTAADDIHQPQEQDADDRTSATQNAIIRRSGDPLQQRLRERLRGK